MDRRVASREPTPNVSACQQAMVLCVLGCFHGFTRIVASGLGMLPCMCSAFNLFFQLSVLRLTLQKARAGHQDGIVYLFTQFKCLRRLGAGIIKVSYVEVKQPAVFQHAADSVMMVV